MQTFATRRHYRFLLFFFTFVIVLAGAAAAAGWVFFVFPTSLGEGYGAVIATIEQMQRILLAKVVVAYAVMTVFMIGALVVLHLFYSHRIAGPAYRLGKEASIIAKGDLKGNIRFRRKDNLTDMADLLNQVASRYRGRVAALKEYLTAVETHLDAVQEAARGGRQQAVENGMKEIRATMKNIGQVLSEIRT